MDAGRLEDFWLNTSCQVIAKAVNFKKRKGDGEQN